MSNNRSTIAILGGVGASLALGISAVNVTRSPSANQDRSLSVGASSLVHSCMHPKVGREIRSIAHEIRKDGVISILPIATGLRESERLSAMKALEAAVRTWNAALDSITARSTSVKPGLKLVVDEDIADPDVRVEFSRVAYAAGQPVAGSIRWQDTAHAVGAKYVAARTLVLTLGTVSSQGEAHRYFQITNTIAHQIGHALGLSDLPNTGGVMDLETVTDQPRAVSGDDLAEFSSVLSGRDEASCHRVPDGRWIY